MADVDAGTGAEGADADWIALLDSLRPIGAQAMAKLVDPDDPRLREMVRQQLLGALTQAFQTWLVDDPRAPRFQPGINVSANLAAPNGDTVYHYVGVDGTGTYRLSGFRGTSRLVNLSMGEFWQTRGVLAAGRSNRSFDELQIGPDGAFSVLISNEKPAHYTGDWWQLDPSVETLGLREVFYDWDHEEPLRIAIERLDLLAPVRPRDPAQVSARLRELHKWVAGESLMWLDHVRDLIARGPANQVEAQSYGTSGVPSQSYYEGIFDIADDEALIIEVKPPEHCFYWSILLADFAFATVDWVNHQGSLNGTQVELDADGIFRAVLSIADPGVPNWLDPAGRRKGIIQGRWTRSSSTPTPEIRKVPLADLRMHLPAGTPNISSEERDARLRKRRVAAHLKGIGM